MRERDWWWKQTTREARAIPTCAKGSKSSTSLANPLFPARLCARQCQSFVQAKTRMHRMPLLARKKDACGQCFGSLANLAQSCMHATVWIRAHDAKQAQPTSSEQPWRSLPQHQTAGECVRLQADTARPSSLEQAGTSACACAGSTCSPFPKATAAAAAERSQNTQRAPARPRHHLAGRYPAPQHGSTHAGGLPAPSTLPRTLTALLRQQHVHAEAHTTSSHIQGGSHSIKAREHSAVLQVLPSHRSDQAVRFCPVAGG